MWKIILPSWWFLLFLPRSCMASRTRLGKRTGSNSRSSFLLCWRSVCQPAMASNPTIPWSTQDTNLLGMSSTPLYNLRPQTPFWKWWNTQLIDSNDTFCSQIHFLIQNKTFHWRYFHLSVPLSVYMFLFFCLFFFNCFSLSVPVFLVCRLM